jgi:hypothetical protein
VLRKKNKKTPLHRAGHARAFGETSQSFNGFEVIENEIKAGEEESHPFN